VAFLVMGASMETSTSVDRLERFANALHELWFYQRASAHVLAGWIVKFPDPARKSGSARALFQRMSAAASIERSLDALRRASELELRVPRAARARMMVIDGLTEADQVFERLFLDLGPHLVALHERALAAGDEILNGPMLDVLRASLPQIESQIRWAAGELGAPSAGRAYRADAWQGLWSGPVVAEDEVLWRPLDRAPTAVRPAHVDRGIPGALRPIPFDANTDRAGIGLILHNNINGEYTTMELAARCSYEHPDMRTEFHADMARHAADEARHAAALERLALAYGVRYGDYPVFTYTYDALYEFASCAAGSREELLWRLLLRATVQEGSSLDDLVFQAKRREFLQQHAIADAFRCILADELFHVRGGLKWTSELCRQLGKTPAVEREKARAYYEAITAARRQRFVKEHPELVAREIAYHKELAAYRKEHSVQLPMELVLQPELRKAAGFTDEDIAQAARWEFA
jgi:uncharacterized ferritin-like protein (DUF455 family)